MSGRHAGHRNAAGTESRWLGGLEPRYVVDSHEQVLDQSLAADFDGSQFLNFNFPVAGTLGNDYWVRFRLTRGEDLALMGWRNSGRSKIIF